MGGKQFLIVVIITFITIMLWVVLDILHSRTEVHIPSEVQKLLQPINPQFDQDTINKL